MLSWYVQVQVQERLFCFDRGTIGLRRMVHHSTASLRLCIFAGVIKMIRSNP